MCDVCKLPNAMPARGVQVPRGLARSLLRGPPAVHRPRLLALPNARRIVDECEQQYARLHRDELRVDRVGLVNHLLAPAVHVRAVDDRVPVAAAPRITLVIVDEPVDRSIRKDGPYGMHARRNSNVSRAGGYAYLAHARRSR
ncbi:hypothetical protein [Burkholderia sp. Bp9031]|uniref:hypothetical protein n=1 Tax=Burkholderia sp. Bp9031 TaxID=2184566 RepID=UPI001639C749|nr:hypothetical protein [Burkholderia sp. Bp9031]